MITVKYSRPMVSFEDFDLGSNNPLEESGWFIRRELLAISDKWSIKPDLPKKAGYVKKEDRTPLYDAWQNVFNRNLFHPEDIVVLLFQGGKVMEDLIHQKDQAIDELTKVCEDNDIAFTNVRKLQDFLREVADHIEYDKEKWKSDLGRLLHQLRQNPDLWRNKAEAYNKGEAA